MCGRFNLFTNPHLFAEVFSVARMLDGDWGPAYNIAPTQNVVCIRDSDQREFFNPGLTPAITVYRGSKIQNDRPKFCASSA